VSAIAPCFSTKGPGASLPASINLSNHHTAIVYDKGSSHLDYFALAHCVRWSARVSPREDLFARDVA
jgi:hypothetical protein